MGSTTSIYSKKVIPDDYEIVSTIESNQHRITYQARKKVEDEYLIAKIIIKKSYNERDLNLFIQRLNEIDNGFNNPNLVKYDDLINEGEYLILIRPEYNNVLETLSNTELVKYFILNGSKKLLTTICGVLKEFHSNNYYYGGIKLSNILLYYNTGDYLISDHSMKYLDENTPITFESVNYISPEEIEGRELTISIDIWSLGILLYKIKRGNYPFESKTLFKTECNILRGEFQLIRNVEEDNVKMNQLICNMLINDSNKRVTVDEILDQLDNSNEYSNNNKYISPIQRQPPPPQQQQHSHHEEEKQFQQQQYQQQPESYRRQSQLSQQQQQQQQQFEEQYHHSPQSQEQIQQLYDRLEIEDELLINNNYNRRNSELRQALLSPIRSPMKSPQPAPPPVVQINNERRQSQYYEDNKEYSKFISPINAHQKQQNYQQQHEDEDDEMNNNNYSKSNNQKYCYFTEDYKSSGIRISNNGQTIKNNKYGDYSHCFLNVKMEDGTHHFIFKTHGDISAFYFGGSTDNRYRGSKLYNESSSCSISLGNGGGSYLFGGNGDKMKREDFKDILPIKNGKYEMIFNITLRTMSIRQENGNDILLFANIDVPLYPFIVIYDEFNFVDLIKYFKD